MNDPDLKLIAAIAGLVVIAALGWFFRDAWLPAPEPVTAVELAPAPAEESAPTGPQYPVPTPPTDEGLVPLPPLDDSDAYFLLALGDVFGPGIEALLTSQAFIDKFDATVDALPRDRVTEKIRPVGPLQGTFAWESAGGEDPIFLSPENYRRYEVLVTRLATADIDAMVETYRRFYPLLQESYERLGYPGKYFNDRVVEVIDHLLATPEPAGPVELVRPHVLYEFADPSLEALSGGQKMLVRMGPQNAASVKFMLRELRQRLAAS